MFRLSSLRSRISRINKVHQVVSEGNKEQLTRTTQPQQDDDNNKRTHVYQ